MKTTKRALLTSALSLFLCFAMLLGTTFAWFTDSVSTNNNIIKAGNLDIELYWSTDAKTWTEVDEDTNVFKKNALWEPGHTEVVYLKVVNAGSLALKYQLGVNVAGETTGINVNNEPFKLSDSIMFGVADGAKDFKNDRDAAINEVKNVATKLNVPYSKSSKLLAAEENKESAEIVTMVVYMPTTVGNEANHKKGTAAPTINLGINLFATQYTYEEDSFGKDYDKDAAWTGAVDTSWYKEDVNEFTLVTAEQLAGLAKIVNEGTNTFEGKTVKLGADIDLRDVNWTPIGTSANPFKGTFIGKGYTISNLRSVGTVGVGLFGRSYVGAHFEGITVNNAYVSGNDYVGVILGGGYLAKNCIKNCTVIKATVIATPYKLANGNYDGGAKAGGIVGQAYNGNIIGNTVKDSTVLAYRDLGGVVGMLDFDGVNNTVTASGNTVENVTVSYIGVPGKYDDGTPNKNIAAVVGRVGAKASVADDNKVEGVKADKGAFIISTIDELIAFANKVNAGDNFAGKTVLLGANIDLNGMEWTPIGTDAAPFNGNFDGQGNTISNLKITGNKSNVGLFGRTNNGEIRNLTIENATVSGRRNVGVVAGTPYTSKYTNITVKGHVEVNGYAYVGGVGGKNAYADWTNIVVDVDATSYVKADSENYRTYVGGVVGFNGEGAHTFKNITSNIDVYGSTIDVGGAFGIAHYDNIFDNVKVSGNVEIFNAPDAECVDEMGGIAGVWNNGGVKVTFINCEFTGTLTANVAADLTDNTIVGNKYSATGTGELVIVNDLIDDQKVTYAVHTGTNKQVILKKVAADAPAKVVIPEGVDVIGSNAFAASNVKEVVVLATVETFDYAFNQSKVEKVVLSEGITTISDRAFRETLYLEEVVIPSTVTTIANDAFQKTGLKTITIPATVEYIGSTAFGASQIETVIFEGNTKIENKAFRGCKALRNVYMNDVDITFVNTTGQGNCWFCNSESNNPGTSDITFYVKNDRIANKVKVAMGAEITNDERQKVEIIVENSADENGVTTDENGNKYGFADNATELADLIKNGADTVYVGAGEYTSFPTSSLSAEDTLICEPGTVFKGEASLNIKGATIIGATFSNPTGNAAGSQATVNGTFKNCVFTGKNALRYGYAGNTVVFEDCEFIATSVYAIHFDGTTGKDLLFKNCKIVGWVAITGGHKSLTFDGCEIYGNGTYGVIRAYGDATIKNCTFDVDNVNTSDVYQDGIHAVGCTITIENCTNVNGTVYDLVNVSNSGSVTIDGLNVKVVYSADSLVSAFANLNAGDVLYIANDIDMTGKTVSPVTGNKGFTMLGNGYTISNLHSTERALFVAHSGSAAYTFDGVVLENCSVDSATDYAALFVGDGDTSDAITITNCHVKNCTVKSAKYAAAFVAYTAGYNVQNNGPVYSDVLIKNCSMIGGSITGGGSVGVAIAHSSGNVDTTSTVTELTVKDVVITGEDAAHTGIAVGTAHVGKTIINGISYSGVTGNYNTVTVLYGRFVPGTTGTLTIDGTAI